MNLKIGDKVNRFFAGIDEPMVLEVKEITNTKIICRGGWEFDKVTGAEIDLDLGWDGITMTGSYLKEIANVVRI